MRKKNIAYYTVPEHINMSLRELKLKPDCRGHVEHIFYSVNVAENFDELTDLLKRIIDPEFSITEIWRDVDRIRYKVLTPWGDINNLLIIIDTQPKEL